ncbi:stalk domain-containing protein [Brevibacillus marinus]|uniref:stalk domain-containing protein n=1 Tax=Brevibacillus marinus TaxID=2496837 RepID=UPI000F843DF2|nr:stalk domain-containing protein [Brevibacillus marinus]
MWKKKTTIAALSTLLLAGALPAGTNAAVVTKSVQAFYHDIKIRYNGVVVPTTTEPFIIDGTTYVPLRMVSTLFNKNVGWDGTTYTIDITDIPDSRIAALEAQIANKDSQIKSLEQQLQSARNRISALEDEQDDEDDVEERINDLEDDLNDDYEDYFEDLELAVKLDGDEDEIEAEIRVDLGEYKDEWEALSDSDIEELVEDFVNDIWDEFEDADVDGVIYDTDGRKDLYDFEGDASKEEIFLDGDEIE